MYQKEILPDVLAMGISYDEFWQMNPRILNIHTEAHKKRLKEQDVMNWYQGQYYLSAIVTALDGCFNGKKAKSKYIETPIMSNEKFGKTEEEIQQMELEKLVAQEMAWMEKEKLRREQNQGR